MYKTEGKKQIRIDSHKLRGTASKIALDPCCSLYILEKSASKHRLVILKLADTLAEEKLKVTSMALKMDVETSTNIALQAKAGVLVLTFKPADKPDYRLVVVVHDNKGNVLHSINCKLDLLAKLAKKQNVKKLSQLEGRCLELAVGITGSGLIVAAKMDLLIKGDDHIDLTEYKETGKRCVSALNDLGKRETLLVDFKILVVDDKEDLEDLEKCVELHQGEGVDQGEEENLKGLTITYQSVAITRQGVIYNYIEGPPDAPNLHLNLKGNADEAGQFEFKGEVVGERRVDVDGEDSRREFVTFSGKNFKSTKCNATGIAGEKKDRMDIKIKVTKMKKVCISNTYMLAYINLMESGKYQIIDHIEINTDSVKGVTHADFIEENLQQYLDQETDNHPKVLLKKADTSVFSNQVTFFNKNNVQYTILLWHCKVYRYSIYTHRNNKFTQVVGWSLLSSILTTEASHILSKCSKSSVAISYDRLMECINLYMPDDKTIKCYKLKLK